MEDTTSAVVDQLQQSYCLCGQPYDPNIFMIQCDVCKDWFHGRQDLFHSVLVLKPNSAIWIQNNEHIAIEIDKYHCPRCAPSFGSSIYKPYKNWHRHDFWEEHVDHRPVQTGTLVFIRELRARPFNSEGEVVLHMRGSELTEAYVQQHGFTQPVVVEDSKSLGMRMPPATFSLSEVEAYVGGDLDMDVIDVMRQSNVRMTLHDYVTYYNNPNRVRVFNVISMEFSNTGLSRLVDAPLIARKLDWVPQLWPCDYPVERPSVQKYCLMSVKDSYTDFHIDFGGTSVWYHVLSGEKIFYLIKPTPANLTLYSQWMTSTNQSEKFFGDQVDHCFKCTLREGCTMFIPTGWIHAVLTPVDSLVFGGNFLHSLNIPMQLQIYDMERKMKTVEKYRYPKFQTIHWFAAQALLRQITALNRDESKCPPLLLVGLKAMLPYLKLWNTEKDYSTNCREQIPTTINSVKMIKDIAKEIRHAERYLNLLNPPKPERESKRKRKRPVNKDFVDYSQSKAVPHTTMKDTSGNDVIAKSLVKLARPKQIVYEPKVEITQEDILNAPMDFGWPEDLLTQEPAEDTTAMVADRPAPTILKIKLGIKDVHVQGSDLMLPNSIYDFPDDSEKEDDSFGLKIDEDPPLLMSTTTTTTTTAAVTNSPSKLKVRRSKPKAQTSWCVKNKKSRLEGGAAQPMGDSEPKNGIESLLKASALTTDEPGPTSPSTQEAIAGMLSIGQTFVEPTRRAVTSKKPRRLSAGGTSVVVLPESPALGDASTDVHQDDDYIYPSLDNSDDEEVHIFKPRGRTKGDEAWNPKARVGPLLPKMNRPAREGTKKQAIEKVLEAAAAKRATQSHESKKQHKRRKPKGKANRTPVSASTTDAIEAIASGTSSSAVALLLHTDDLTASPPLFAASPSATAMHSGACPTSPIAAKVAISPTHTTAVATCPGSSTSASVTTPGESSPTPLLHNTRTLLTTTTTTTTDISQSYFLTGSSTASTSALLSQPLPESTSTSILLTPATCRSSNGEAITGSRRRLSALAGAVSGTTPRRSLSTGSEGTPTTSRASRKTKQKRSKVASGARTTTADAAAASPKNTGGTLLSSPVASTAPIAGSKAPPTPNITPSSSSTRPKKGMKTAKQRLGKILKIHKMIH